jgi:hypothetical protein
MSARAPQSQRAWLEYVIETAIDMLDALDAPAEDLEDDEREIYLAGVSTDYVAENARGVVLHTFDSPKAAHRWVALHEADHDGLHVVAVITRVTRQRVDERGRFLGRPQPFSQPGDQPHGR